MREVPPHRAVAAGTRSTAITSSAIGNAIPPARVNLSGTPNDRIAAWDPERSKSLEIPDTANTAARISRAASNSPSIRSKPLRHEMRNPVCPSGRRKSTARSGPALP
jgi:hypothetical protein